MGRLDDAVKALTDDRTDRERVETYGGYTTLYSSARAALRLLGADIPERRQQLDPTLRMEMLANGASIREVARSEGVSRQAVYDYWDRNATFEQKESRRLAQEKSQLASSES